jgi:hypothetical protein
MSIAAPVEAPRNIAGIVAAALLFAALAVLLDGPVWLVKLVPTQDGPVHLAQADLIARFGWGGARRPDQADRRRADRQYALPQPVRAALDRRRVRGVPQRNRAANVADPVVAAAGFRRVHPLGIL